jgi:hypothetical protein
MYSDIASEIWGELKRYLNTVDRKEAADVLVSLLIDNDEDAEDIRNAFKGDADIKMALTPYINNDEEEYEEEDSDDEDNEDWDE